MSSHAIRMRSLSIALLAALTMALAMLASPPPAAANHYSWVYNQRSGYVKMHYAPGSSGGVWLKNNTRFVMLCYLDVSWNYTGNYSSRRWFRGQSWTQGYGYVHSSYVYYQKTVRRC